MFKLIDYDLIIMIIIIVDLSRSCIPILASNITIEWQYFYFRFSQCFFIIFFRFQFLIFWINYFLFTLKWTFPLQILMNVKSKTTIIARAIKNVLINPGVMIVCALKDTMRPNLNGYVSPIDQLANHHSQFTSQLVSIFIVCLYIFAPSDSPHMARSCAIIS